METKWLEYYYEIEFSDGKRAFLTEFKLRPSVVVSADRASSALRVDLAPNSDAFYEVDPQEVRRQIAQAQEKEAKAVAAERARQTARPLPAIGMSRAQVLASRWGRPHRVNRTTTANGTTEQWVYHGLGYLYLENGVVRAIQD